MDTQINLPRHIAIGSPVKVAEWVGMVEDIATGQSHVMILVSSPKQLYRHAPAEWLEFHPENPDLIRPATRLDYAKECKRYAEMIEREKARLFELALSEPVKVTAQVERKPESVMNEIKGRVLKILGTHARNVFISDFNAWRQLERTLEADDIVCELEPEDNPEVIRIAGLGIKAAAFQDRYALAFERSFMGEFNHPVALSFVQ